MKLSLSASRMYLIGGISAIVLVGAFWFFMGGYYPVAMVNGTPITASQYVINVRAAKQYYENYVKTYAEDALSVPELPEGALQRAVLGELIDRTLIRDGAQKEIGKDLSMLVNDRLDSEVDIESLMKESEALYGLTADELMSEVLVPQATQDLLSGRLYLKQEKLEDWILDARKKANVILFLGNMKWDGEQVATST